MSAAQGTSNGNDIIVAPTNYQHGAFHDQFTDLLTALSYFNGFALLLGVLCNGAALYIFVRNRNLWKVRYFLAANLTLADFCLCCINFPIFLYNATQGYYAAGQLGCTLHGYFIVLFCSQSVLTLIAITYERYITIVKAREFTRRQFWWVLPLNWCFSVALAGMPFLWSNTPYPLRSSRIYCTGGWYLSRPYEVLFTVLCFIVISTGLVGITYMYREVFNVIHQNTVRLTAAGGRGLTTSSAGTSCDGHMETQKHTHKGSQTGTAGQQTRIATDTFPGLVGAPSTLNRANISTSRKALRNERTIARITLVIVLTFFLCWGVYNMMFLLEMFTQKEAAPLLDGISATAALVNSTCNPFIYLFDKNLKSAALETLGLHRKSTPQSPTQQFLKKKKQKQPEQPQRVDISVIVTVEPGETKKKSVDLTEQAWNSHPGAWPAARHATFEKSVTKPGNEFNDEYIELTDAKGFAKDEPSADIDALYGTNPISSTTPLQDPYRNLRSPSFGSRPHPFRHQNVSSNAFTTTFPFPSPVTAKHMNHPSPISPTSTRPKSAIDAGCRSPYSPSAGASFVSFAPSSNPASPVTSMYNPSPSV